MAHALVQATLAAPTVLYGVDQTAWTHLEGRAAGQIETNTRAERQFVCSVDIAALSSLLLGWIEEKAAAKKEVSRE